MKKIEKEVDFFPVALYVRTSTVDQEPGIQEQELRAYANSRGMEIKAVFVDASTGTNTDRPAYQYLLNRLPEFKAVLVWKLDRWSRSLSDLALSLRFLESNDVKFISLRDQIDLTTPVGRFMLHILGAVAEFEIELMRERVKAGMAYGKAQGKKFGAPRQFDYERIQSLHKSAHSYRNIASQVGCSLSTVQNALGKRAK